MIELQARREGTVVSVRAQPGARKDGLQGVHAGAVRVAVSAPPDRGRANAAIQKVLADLMECKASDVELLTGASNRQKRFLIRGRSIDEVRGRLFEALGLSPDSTEQ